MGTSGAGTNLDLTKNSISGGVVAVTIGAGADSIQPSSQPCRSCTIQHYSGTQAYMNVDADATADEDSWKISKTSGAHLEYEIDDLNKLHFIGTAGDIVQIIYRA